MPESQPTLASVAVACNDSVGISLGGEHHLMGVDLNCQRLKQASTEWQTIVKHHIRRGEEVGVDGRTGHQTTSSMETDVDLLLKVKIFTNCNHNCSLKKLIELTSTIFCFILTKIFHFKHSGVSKWDWFIYQQWCNRFGRLRWMKSSCWLWRHIRRLFYVLFWRTHITNITV